MVKYFAFIACLIILSCGQKMNIVSDYSNYTFLSQNHMDELDQKVEPVVKSYLELIKGLNNKDTLYLYQNANQLLQMVDSLASSKKIENDKIQKIWTDGLNNFNSELQGLQFTIGLNDWEETKTSIHMCGLQLLNLLAQIGYKEHQIYVFKTVNNKSEDGFLWLGLQKEMKDPFNPQNKKELAAEAVLQEIK